MIIKFKAYACMKDKECGWKRIEESIHETEIEAKKAALHLEGKYPDARYTAEILEISGGGYRRSGAI